MDCEGTPVMQALPAAFPSFMCDVVTSKPTGDDVDTKEAALDQRRKALMRLHLVSEPRP